LGLNLEDYPKDDPQVAAQMTAFFLAWRSQAYRPTLLVIDELVKIQAMQPKWYKDFLIPQCIVEGSSGETDKRYLYLVTQSPLVGDLGMSGGNRSTFDFMAIEKASTSEHLESVRKSVTSLRSTPSAADYQRSPVGCLAFHSGAGCWFAVPEYGVPRIAAGDELCAELLALVRPGVESGVLPQEWGEIGRAMVAMNSTKVVTQKGDAIEVAILEFLKSRSDGATAGRMRADKYALKTLSIGELEEYLQVLVAEEKVVRDGNVYFLV
jgi:hypothetical protein